MLLRLAIKNPCNYKGATMSFTTAGVAKKILVFLMCFLLSVVTFAGDNAYKVAYDGGSLPDVKAGTGLKMYLDSDHIRFQKDKTEIANIPASAITEISYGQDVHRRVGTAVAVGVFTLGVGALTALSKSKKHYVGLTWADGDKKGGLAMQCDKNDYRGILAGLEGVTGKKAVDSEAMTVKN
jgi:hypothetical protein